MPKPLSIQEKIKRAGELFGLHGRSIGREPRFREMLEELGLRLEESSRVMDELGVSALCKRCDEAEGGSCCGRGIEDRYRVPLLLLNLALGARLPETRDRENSCFFLGAGGCLLRVRDILCVNYLCRRIEEKLTRKELIRLQETTGREMDLTFRACEAVKRLVEKYEREGRKD